VFNIYKKFSSPKIKIWFEPMFFYGFFCGFEWRGFAAFPNFRGGDFLAAAGGEMSQPSKSRLRRADDDFSFSLAANSF